MSMEGERGIRLSEIDSRVLINIVHDYSRRKRTLSTNLQGFGGQPMCMVVARSEEVFTFTAPRGPHKGGA